MPPMYSLSSSSAKETYRPYSWHQSHDQATVLLMVPLDTEEEEIHVIIEKDYVIAGIRGQMPIVKGKLYANVDTANSIWQLEPRGGSATRERTTSSASSSSSSYAFVSDGEFSTSFAPSSAEHSDFGSSGFPSPALPSSPALKPRPASPRRDLSYSYSSLESLQTLGAGKLLTLHLEKQKAAFWPSLVIGPCPDVTHSRPELEYQYNMDPTSLVLLGLDLFDIRRNKEEAFECFLRAWQIAHVPTSTVKLVSIYLPLSAPSSEYVRRVGGPSGLAQLYLEAGMLHLDGSWHGLLSSPHASISSLRLPEGGEGWKRDREAARALFERAHTLDPVLEIPELPEHELKMPCLDLHVDVEQSEYSDDEDGDATEVGRIIEKRKKIVDESSLGLKDLGNAWHVYLPGLIGAGTAVVAVGVIGFLSLSWSRRNQSS